MLPFGNKSHMLVGAKVCELTEDLLWFVCGNFDFFPIMTGPSYCEHRFSLRVYIFTNRQFLMDLYFIFGIIAYI